MSRPAPPDLGRVIWITGLSGTGKSTVARALVDRLRADGEQPVLLDGDELRAALDAEGLVESEQRRRLALNYARLCRLLARQGHVVVCATVSLHHEVHSWNRRWQPGYLEVLLDVPLPELRRRDPKGIYRRGRSVVGLTLPAEFPRTPDLVLRNFGVMSPASAADHIHRHGTGESHS